MEEFALQVFSGLASGIIYGSVALALVMIYQATHHINFAQGEMATFSTFIAWWLIQRGWPYWGAFFATVVPSPSSPEALLPHDRTVPSASRAME